MVLEKEDCRVSTKLMAVEPDVFILKVKSDYSLPLYQFSTRVFQVLEQFNVAVVRTISSGVCYTLIINKLCQKEDLCNALSKFAKVDLFTGCAAIFMKWKDRLLANEFAIQLNYHIPVMLISYDIEFCSFCICVDRKNINFVQKIIPCLKGDV